MNLQPLSNHVLLEPVEEQITKSGIVIPDTAEKKKKSRAKVVAVGTGKLNDKGEHLPISVKVGDMVLFKEPWGEESKLKIEGKEYMLVEEDDILAIINN